MARSFKIGFLFYLLAVTQIAFSDDPADTTASTPQKLDLKYVPSDAVAISVIQPHRLFSGPWGSSYTLLMKKLEEAGLMSFNPAEIEQAVLVIGLPNSSEEIINNFPRFGVVARYGKAADQDSLAAKIVPQGSDGSIEGRKVRINAHRLSLSCAFADANTLLIGHESVLRWLLTAKQVDSPLRKLAAAADDSPEWQLLLTVGPLRPQVQSKLAETDSILPPQFNALPKMVDSTDTIVATLRQLPQGPMQFDLSAMASNKRSAKELVDDFKQLLDGIRIMFLAQPQTTAGADRIRSVINPAIAALQPTQSGNHVNIHVEMQSGPAPVMMVVAMLIPAVQAARDAANRVSDANNLKRLGLALLNYTDAHKRMPAQAIYDTQGKPLLSWRVMLLPYLEQNELYKQYHLDEPWDSEHNKQLIEKMPNAFMYPEFDEAGKTLYQAVFSKGFPLKGPKEQRQEVSWMVHP